MSHLAMSRKITGLSAEKWTLHQLKALQPRMQQAIASSATKTYATSTVINDLVNLFSFGSNSSEDSNRKVLKSLGAELLSDVIKTLTVHHCSPEGNSNNLSYQLSEEIFQCFSESHFEGSAEFSAVDSEDNAGMSRQSSTLGTLAGLGSIGFEDNATLLLDHVSTVLSISNENTSTDSLIKFTVLYLQFLQAVMNFHGNRKKLFTNICEVLLPSVMRLLSHCSTSNHAGGSLATLQTVLSEVIEKGLFDEKNVEELATLHLAASSTTSTNHKSHPNKKQKVSSDQRETVDRESTEETKNAKVENVKNKSFHDILFRTLESRYYASTEGVDSSLQVSETIFAQATSYASGVACLFKIYCAKSASLALQASTQQPNLGFQARGSHNSSARNDSLGMDAVNTRKHLVRVFHFLFLVLEAFHTNKASSVDSLIQELKDRACGRKPATEPTTTPGKKRKQIKQNSESCAWSLNMVHLLKARLLRNAVLAACVETVTQQAIPNHDSLYRYVELLVTLSSESVKDCVKLQSQVAESVEAFHADAEFSHSIMTADLECVRLVALIDHTTVVDHRLPSVVQVLGAFDATGFRGDADTSSHAGWVENHFAAKRDLFGVVLRVHGELRLLDQLVGQLTLLDKQHVSGAQASMLHAVISTGPVSRNLVALFSAAPIGQLPQHWANLSGTVFESSEPQPANVQVGIVTCCLARALMEAQLHSVRSNISVFSAENSSSDAVDANTVNMTVLLWRLACTVQSLVSAQNAGTAATKGAFHAPLVQNVLSTLSVLLRFVAHFHAGTIKQLTVPCLTAAGSDSQLSFHGIAMTLLLNNLIALRLDDITFVPVVKALLSLVLLNSNITAKVRSAALDFVPQTTILSKYTLDILTGSGNGASAELSGSTKLDLMHLVLCDIRIWSQFVQSTGLEVPLSSPFLKSKQLVSLFQNFIRAGVIPVAETSLQVTRIASILTSAAVADNQFVREAVHIALQTEWLVLDAPAGKKSSSRSDAVAARSILLASLRSLFGSEFLYSATFFMPAVFAHLVATRAQSSRAGAAAASNILLGHLRSAPSERYTSLISQYPVKSTVLDAALYFLTGQVVATEDVDSKLLDSALTQVFELARTVLQDEAPVEEDCSLALVNLLIDILVSRLVQQFNIEESDEATTMMKKVITFIKEISIGRHHNSEAVSSIQHTALGCFVSAPVRKIENSTAKDVNPSDLLIVAALHQLVSDVSERLLQRPTNKVADVQADSADLHSIGEAVVVISAMVQKSAQTSLSEAAQSDVIRAMFQHASTVLGCQTVTKRTVNHTSGWLYLFGALSEQILLRFGVVTLPQIAEAPTGDMYLPITVSLSQLELLCGVLQRMLTLELKAVDSEMSTADSTALTMPVVSMLTNLLNAVLSSRICNCEPHQILSSLKNSLLLPLQRGDSVAQSFVPVLCRDVLIYFTEHGRKLLPGGKLPQEKFQQFHESLIELTVSTYQDIIAEHRGQTAEDVNQLAALLYHTNCVTATVSAVLQRQGRGGARRKNKENDTKSTLFRCDLWFDGLLSTITLITSHMHMWHESNSTIGSTSSALECNASTVLLAKSLLQNMERLVSVSTSSSLPNLNTAIGAIVLTITSTVTLLLHIDNAVLAQSVSSHRSAAVLSLQLNLNSCYHLICRVLSTVASSQVLEKHVHFIACAAVEGLSKATVSRAFQEVAYPGIYALFEKCQSRQKTQMFAMLDAQSRTLMTDLHNEFMRSFKFVGK